MLYTGISYTAFTCNNIFTIIYPFLYMNNGIFLLSCIFEPTDRCKSMQYNIIKNEPVHEISNNLVCATSKASDQPVHTRSLIQAFACHLSILWSLSYWMNTIWSVYKLKKRLQRVIMSKCHIVGNHMSLLK